MPEPAPADLASELSRELTLNNGVTLPNRIAKPATSEHLATRHGAPPAG